MIKPWQLPQETKRLSILEDEVAVESIVKEWP